MPDWSYQPLFRPLLFRLPAERARNLTMSALGRLAAMPFGPGVIELMGHMQPPPSLERRAWGITFPSPVGLGPGLDAHATGLAALARFGVGFVEVGPVSEAPIVAPSSIRRRLKARALWYPDPQANDGGTAIAARLACITPLPVPLGIRLGHAPGAAATTAAAERCRLVTQFAQYADFFVLDHTAETDNWHDDVWRAHLQAVLQASHALAAPRPVLIALRPDTSADVANTRIACALELGITGIVVGGGVQATNGGRLEGGPARVPSLALVGAIHKRWGARVTIIAGDGVHEPADALRLLGAGAILVQVSSGLVYAGPGLPKRINETIAFEQQPADPQMASSISWRREVRSQTGWLWFALLGLGMIFSGVLAWIIAATRVVLPYDEAFVGLNRGALVAINPRLLPFMAHDRVTLAGTMISIGVLYAGLALCGVRRGAHWARRAIVASAGPGFASFFLFLGFGYFDPLHALAATLLLPFFILGWLGRAQEPAEVPIPDLGNDARWCAGVTGQFLFVGLGAGLVAAGLSIAAVGVTRVFVPEDLLFLQTSPAALHAANARLIALIAHDRAGFGGALASNGIAVLLLALWGFRRGAAWVWWTLLGAGVPGFAGALGVHLAVGYLNLIHVLPALVAAVVYLVALLLAYPFLVQRDRANERDALSAYLRGLGVLR